MTIVLASTEELVGLEEDLERRRREGRDTYDEWWDGVYRIVTGPTPEHGRLLGELYVLFRPLALRAGLHMALPINIGTDKANCRVPDMGVYRPDTPRTSPAFLATAELVVEVLSPGETPSEKLPFYAEHGVKEYLEIDLTRGTASLIIVESIWDSSSIHHQSEVLGFEVSGSTISARSARDPGEDLAGNVVDITDFRLETP